MTNPTDPEEQRLLLELAEASLGLHDDMALAKCYNSVEAETRFDDALNALRDHRAKASAPEPAPLLPCPFCGNQPNEIGDIGRSIFIACESCDAAGPEALSEVEAKALWNARHSPALPNTPQIPTHESIIQWAKEKDKESLRTGKALKWTELIPDFARVFGLAHPDERVEPTDEAIRKFVYDRGWSVTADSVMVRFAEATLDYFSTPSPIQPAPAVEISDEEIEFVWRAYGEPFVNDDGKRSFAAEQFSDAARHLAKRSSATSLSNETLRDLWRLAHQEALDQFVIDAKGIIGR